MSTRRALPRRLAIMIALTALLAACGGSSSGASATQTFEAIASPAPGVSAVPSTTPTAAAFETPVASTPPPTPSISAAPFRLTSAAFAANGPIPGEYTCKDADRSPELAWTGVPAGTQALVLLVDDPDGRDWVHWSVLDLEPSTSGLPAGVKPAQDPPQQGTNDFGKVGYGGPCPPSGTHHYQFTLYALAAPLSLDGHPKGAAVRSALAKANPIAKVTLVGTFAH